MSDATTKAGNAAGERGSRRRGAAGKDARSAARLAAVQGLYQMDLAQTALDDVIAGLGSAPVHEAADGEPETELHTADVTFLAELLRGVVRRQREIDPMIDKQLAVGWRLSRVDSILRAVLRAGVFELMERTDVPARVVITEYVDVAHAFLADDEPRVVNGVLDKLARRLRPGEFEVA